MFVEHWTFIQHPSSHIELTPRSYPTILQPCQGYSLHSPYFTGSLRPKCTIRLLYRSSILIEMQHKATSREILANLHLSTSQHFIAHRSHPLYRTLAYNDYLVRSRITDANAPTLHPAPLGHNVVPNAQPNQLITKLISDSSIQQDLIRLATSVREFQQLSFYTDGSYNPVTLAPELPMGFGWTTSNLDSINLHFHGGCNNFPSSTKAKIMALFTALIICPLNCSVTIYLDSQAAIDGYHTTK